jgi:hypothetical protein
MDTALRDMKGDGGPTWLEEPRLYGRQSGLVPGRNLAAGYERRYARTANTRR